MKTKAKLNPVEKMIGNKRRLVERLERDIERIKRQSEQDIQKIRFRIQIATTLADALEKK